MASVRIEDGVFTDPRFVVLGKKLGESHFAAIGRMAAVWSYCTERQIYGAKGSILDALSGVTDFGKLLVESELATADEVLIGWFHISGTKGRIEWLAGLREGKSAGGKARSAGAKRGANGRFNPAPVQQDQHASSTPSSTPPARSSVLVPVPVPAPVLAPVKKEKTKKEKEEAPAIADAPGNLIPVYCEAFKRRYGTNPTINGQALGTAKRLVKDLGFAKASTLLETYLCMNDSWFLTRRHDLPTFESSLNAVTVKHNTGVAPTRTEIQAADRTQANANVWGKLIAEAEEKNGR